MTRVIHTGDTHLGYRQYHSPTRREDFLDAFRQVVQDAIEDDVDAVVHAGDLYHDRRPGLQDLLGTIDVLEPLRENDIPFLAVVGNHEGTRDAQWLDLFETLGLAERLDASGRRVGDAVFYGMDYVPESRRDALDYEFTSPSDHPDADAETDEPPNLKSALVSHGLFTPFAHANWDLETVLRESNVDFDAVLLGDNHTPDTVQVDGTWVTYCGSTERSSASERDPRGYNIVEFGDEVTITRRGLDTRNFVFVDIDLASGEGPEFVIEKLRERDLDGAVVIVTIEGAGESITPAELEEFGRDQGALVTRVNDRRELDTPEANIEVSFADPDEAVRERVREMGLSDAAREVDQTVRDATVADTNVRERIRSHVEESVDDPDAFESVDPEELTEPTKPESEPDASSSAVLDSAEHSTAGDGNPDDTDATEAPETTTSAGGEDAAETQPETDGVEAVEAEGGESADEAVETVEAEGDGVKPGSDSDSEEGADGRGRDDPAEAPSKDGENATMEDFL